MAELPPASDPPYEAMASPTEVTDGELSENLSTIHYPPAERSRSDYGRALTMVPADTRVRQPPVPMILTRGYNPNASREGMHVSSWADPGTRGSGSQQTLVQRSDNHFNQLNIANTVLVASQDPAMTSLIEATAELRHGEHVAEIKSEAERSWGQTSSCPCPSRAGAREESEWSGRNFAHACRGSRNVGKGRAQWINHASKKQEGGGVVGDCEMPEMPRLDWMLQCMSNSSYTKSEWQSAATQKNDRECNDECTTTRSQNAESTQWYFACHPYWHEQKLKHPKIKPTINTKKVLRFHPT